MYVYNIIDVSSGATLATFDTPQSAVAAVMDYPGVKTRIVKAPRVDTNAPSDDDPAVSTKEAAMKHIASKFEDGTYHRPRLLSPSDPWFTPESLETFERALGFSLSDIPEDMCIHKSTQDPSKVCYVRWNERGQPTTTRVSYPRLLEILGSTDVVSRDIGCFLRAVNCNGAGILSRFRLHKRIDNIVDVYMHGPQSCMAHGEEHYETEGYGHPVGVYGRPDNNNTSSPLGVYSYDTGVWMNTYDDDDDDDDDDPRECYYTARTLVDHQAKIFSRLYGEHAEVLAGYLRSIGYTRDGEGDMSFASCGSWFCPNVVVKDTSVSLVMPYVDNYGYGYYDIRDGRLYFGDAPERVEVNIQTTSGIRRASGLGTRMCLCCGAEFVAPRSDRDVEKALGMLGWHTYACPTCNKNGAAKESYPTHVRTLVVYSLEYTEVYEVAPITPVELALISEGSHVLVFKEGQLRLYTRPEHVPNDWEEVYPGVYWADGGRSKAAWDIPQQAAREYLLWICEFLPPSWFDESFMWVHRNDEVYFFVDHPGSRAKKYTTLCDLFVGYKYRWSSSVRRRHPLVAARSLFSPSLRRLVGVAPVTYSNALKEWQDANNNQ